MSFTSPQLFKTSKQWHCACSVHRSNQDVSLRRRACAPPACSRDAALRAIDHDFASGRKSDRSMTFSTASVMIDKTQSEHNKSGYPPIADIGAEIVFRRFVPEAVIPRSIVKLKVHAACCR